MGIQDRDYYHEKRDGENRKDTFYDPKRFREGRTPTTIQPAKGSWQNLVKNILVWIVIGLILTVIFSRYAPVRQQVRPQPAARMPAAMAQPRNCEPLPPSGSPYIVDPAVMRRTDVLYSGLEVQNKHNFPMVVVLSDPTGVRRYQAVSVSPSVTAQLSVPIGQYGMQVLVGSSWCNLEEGFSDGAKVSINGGLSIQAGVTTLVQFSVSGLRPEQFSVAYSTTRPVSAQDARPPAQVIGRGSLDLQQTRGGHYFSSGAVNGFPVVFMVDTGATIVSISSTIASRAGIQNCVPRTFSTANGNVNACTAIVSEVSFGGFRLTDIEVAIMPNMSGDALLGMNVLRNFHIEQIGEAMRISTR